MVLEYYRELEDKLSTTRKLVDDTQEKQGLDRKENAGFFLQHAESIRTLGARLAKVDELLSTIGSELQSTLRLERAAALLSKQGVCDKS